MLLFSESKMEEILKQLSIVSKRLADIEFYIGDKQSELFQEMRNIQKRQENKQFQIRKILNDE